MYKTTYPSMNLDMIMMGPKDSSMAMKLSSATSVKTVGWRNRPEI